MKKLASAICLLVILMSTLLLNGCGFFEDDSGIMISKIEKTGVLADGSTEITIKFTDPAEDDLIFTIPPGKAGEKGAGIKSATQVPTTDGTGSIITIEFDDQSIAPVITTLKDGKTVTSITTEWDDDAKTYFLVFYNGEDVLASTEVPELSGILGFTDAVTNKDGSLTFAIQWGTTDNVEEHEITIPAGNGISYMDAYTDAEGYHVNVYYTNPNMGKEHNGMDSFLLPKPQDPNQWFSGTVEPTEGIRDGDFWFDERNKTIYTLKNGEWKFIIGFNDIVPDYHEVKFFLNDGTLEGEKIPITGGKFIIPHGNSFGMAEYDIPIPTRPDDDSYSYTFAGWYPHSTETNQLVYPIFNAITPVYTDINLYAHWEKTPLETPAE